MVALLPLAIEPQTAHAGLFKARIEDDAADIASVLSGAVLRGDRFIVFTADQPETRLHVLEMLAEILAEQGVNVELRDPAEIYQLTDGLEPTEHSTELAVWASASSGYPYARRPLFVVENAESLQFQTMEFLWLAATVFLTGPPAPQILFLGRTQFQDLLLSHECRGIREHILTNVTVAPAPIPIAGDRAPAPAGIVPSPALPVGPARTARSPVKWISAGAAFLVIGIVAALGLTSETPPPGRPGQAPPAVRPQEAQAVAPVPRPTGPAAAPGPTDPSMPVAQPAMQVEPRQPRPQAQAQPSQTPASTADAASAPAEEGAQQKGVGGPTRLNQSHVVVLFRAGSASSEGRARQIAASLGDHVASAEIRPATSLPRVPRIRYFGLENRDAAMELGAVLTSALGKSLIRRQADPLPNVTPEMIEVQLPRPQLPVHAHVPSRATRH